MFQLGSDSCWGLAADMANRQLNIYVLPSSGKQTPFWGSAAWAVKSFYLCGCLHNSNNSFMLNACKFKLNHDLSQGLSGVKMHTHKVQRGNSNNLFFLHKGLCNRGGHPLSQIWRLVLVTAPMRAVKAACCSQTVDRLSRRREGILL